MSRAPQPIRRVLSAGAASLLEQVGWRRRLTALLHDCLDSSLAVHVQAANLRNNRLVIQADSAAWATRLRYLAPQLLSCLRSQPQLAQLVQLEVRIAPQTQVPIVPPRPMRLSASNARLLEATAECTQHAALRAALKRLSRRAR